MPLDKQLQQAVLAELDWEPSVVAAHIGVTANAGVVTLTGHVETFAEKNAAETAARRVRGVKAVAENIQVELALNESTATMISPPPLSNALPGTPLFRPT